MGSPPSDDHDTPWGEHNRNSVRNGTQPDGSESLSCRRPLFPRSFGDGSKPFAGYETTLIGRPAKNARTFSTV